MADKAISDLTSATSIGDGDLFVLEQSGEAKSITGSLLKDVVKLSVSTAEPTDKLESYFNTIYSAVTNGKVVILEHQYTIGLLDQYKDYYLVTNYYTNYNNGAVNYTYEFHCFHSNKHYMGYIKKNFPNVYLWSIQQEVT